VKDLHTSFSLGEVKAGAALPLEHLRRGALIQDKNPVAAKECTTGHRPPSRPARPMLLTP
jgi:hypothetical protein